MLTPTEILNCLANPPGRLYPRAAIEAAVAQRDEMVPVLLGVLEEVCREPQSYLERAGDQRAIYACLLLGYFREPRAHAALLRIAALPEEDLECFGGMITEDLTCLLYRTSGSDVSGLLALVQLADAWLFCRSAAMDALVLKVADGSLARPHLLTFLQNLLVGAPDDVVVWSMVANAACDLHPGELLPALRHGCKKGLVAGYWVGIDDLEDAALQDPGEALAEARRQEESRHPEDIHAWCSWWACYKGPGRAGSPVTLAGRSAAAHPSDAQRRKQRRKAERAARRRNRRRK